MKTKKIYFFIGTNAEFIKIAPVFKELIKRKVSFRIITSGQNTIDFKGFLDLTGPIQPYIAFPHKLNKASSFYFLLWAIKTLVICPIKLRKEFKNLNKQNCYFIIHGDTVTSLIGGIIGKIFNLKLVHIESGYLSHNFLEPFPEEICRNINIRLADIRFSPTDWTMRNLKNRKGESINTKENTIIESFWWAMKKNANSNSFKKFKKYYILILHRQEHVVFRKDWSKNVLNFVIKNADPSLTCILLNHPLTVEIIKTLDITGKKIEIISEVTYPQFISLMKNSEFIASDGATNQQETYYMGKPFLILREYTEQSEGLGRNAILSQGHPTKIKRFLRNYKQFKKPSIIPQVSPSKIIVDYLTTH